MSSTRTNITFRAMGKARIGIVMGSASDWPVMEACAATLDEFGIVTDRRVLSAHRTPDAAIEWGRNASDAGLQVIIAAAGGAAHLAGVMAAVTPLPVLGVPMESASLKGMDSLLSMVQMPAGIPVATFAIGKAGAVNAALFAVALLALGDKRLAEALTEYRRAQTLKVMNTVLQ